jgi:hypothetical protein
MLLLFPGIYLNDGEEIKAAQELESCFTKLQVFEHGNRTQLAKNVVANRRVDSSWRHDQRLGWLCDGIYAQRNPKSQLSNLREDEFIRIKHFFSNETT